MSMADDYDYDVRPDDMHYGRGQYRVIKEQPKMKVNGVVGKIYSREFPSKYGKGSVTLWSFTVQGNNKFYRTGEKKPDFRETDFVTFEADDKGQVSNLEVSKAPEGEATAAKAAKTTYSAPPTGTSSQSRDGYWSEKEARDIHKEERYQNVVEPRITYSSSQSDAVRVVGLALQHDLLAFGNANKSAKLGLLLDYVDQVTLRFANQRMNASTLLSGAVTDDVPEEVPAASDLDS